MKARKDWADQDFLKNMRKLVKRKRVPLKEVVKMAGLEEYPKTLDVKGVQA